MTAPVGSPAAPSQHADYAAHELPGATGAGATGAGGPAGGGSQPGGSGADARGGDGLRTLISESWRRSLHHLSDPEAAGARLVFDEAQLAALRGSHPLAAIMPVIDRLLVQPSHEAGMLVAVGDDHGRLLWVDGDRSMRRRAESMLFVAGADWSDRTVGTSAPGTALALDRGVQISGTEHFSRQVHRWSCTAVPLHDPDSGALLGVVDITGGDEAVASHTLSLVRATVAAAEAQLRIARLELAVPEPARTAGAKGSRTRSGPGSTRSPLRPLYRDSLHITGRNQGRLRLGGRSLELSLRHSEILTLLALHPQGLGAEELAGLLYEDARTTRLRAEMVRLRRLIEAVVPAAVPASRPYRLPGELILDAGQVLAHLRRGAHRMALELYRGPVLPHSMAPGIGRYRTQVSTLLREAVLNDAAADTLLNYLQLPEAQDDAEAWQAALRLLPRRSPKRPAVVAQLERIEAELG